MNIPALLYPPLNALRKLYWRMMRPKTFGVKVMIEDNAQFLFVQHSYEKGAPWTFAGGGFNPKKETPEQAAAREVAEELGITLQNARVIGVYNSTAQYKQDTVYCLHAAAIASCIIKTSSEISAYSWHSLDTLPTPLNTAAKKTINFFITPPSA